jgi:signal transduction histidine kinase
MSRKPEPPPAELRDLMAAALLAVHEPISVTAADAAGGRVAFVNPAFTELTGYPADEVVGGPPPYAAPAPQGAAPQSVAPDTTAPGGDAPDVPGARGDAPGGPPARLPAGGPADGEIAACRKDGSRLWLDLRSAPIRDASGSVTHWVTSHRDVGARRQGQDAVERSGLAKSMFLSRLSHELMTPLNSLLGFPELLLGGHLGPLGETQRRAITSMLEAGEQLRALLQDLLDLARIDSGRLRLERSCFDLGPLLADLAGPVSESAQRKGLSLAVEVAPDLPPVDGDPRRLKQVALNLLDNAVKYTAPGGWVKLRAWPARSPAGTPLVRLAVADSGIGIRREDHERIFTLFEQVDPSLTRRQPGTGLGLALVKRLLDLHGGRAWVESAGEGQGSTFHVEIPALPEAEAASRS